MSTYATPQQVAAARAAAVHLGLEVPFGRGYDGVAAILARAGLTLRPLRTARDRRRLREAQACWDCGQAPAVGHAAAWHSQHTPFPACCRECLATRRRILWDPQGNPEQTAPRPPHRRGLRDQCGAAMPAGWRPRWFRVIVSETQDVAIRDRFGRTVNRINRNELTRFVLRLSTPQERHRAAGAAWVAAQVAEDAHESREEKKTRATARGSKPPAPWVVRMERTLTGCRYNMSPLRGAQITYRYGTTGRWHRAPHSCEQPEKGRYPWRPWRDLLYLRRVECSTESCGNLTFPPVRLHGERPQEEKPLCGACITSLLWEGLQEQERRNAGGPLVVVAPPVDLSWQEEAIE